MWVFFLTQCHAGQLIGPFDLKTSVFPLAFSFYFLDDLFDVILPVLSLDLPFSQIKGSQNYLLS